MDGTLLNSKKELPKKLFALLDILKAQNVRFGAASGRQYFNLFAQFGEYAKDMVFIAENGGILYDGTTPLSADELPKEDMKQIISHMRKATKAYPILCGVKSAYLEVEDPQFLTHARMYYTRLKIVEDLMEVLDQDQIAKIAIYDAIDSQTNANAFLKGFTGSLLPVVSAKDWVDLSNPGVSKGKAIRFLKAKEHLKPEELMVFGDFMNDYEMMKEAHYSYAMANAVEEIKAVSHYQAESNDEDGVIKAICQMFAIDYQAL